MIVLCNPCPSNGVPANDPRDYSITGGRKYLVLGITFVSNPVHAAASILYQVLNDHGGVSHVPADLFSIENGQCSAFWAVRQLEDGSMLVWPQEFFVEFFHDDLSEGVRSAVDVLRSVVGKLAREANFDLG
jgi:hypothetical protein